MANHAKLIKKEEFDLIKNSYTFIENALKDDHNLKDEYKNYDWEMVFLDVNNYKFGRFFVCKEHKLYRFSKTFEEFYAGSLFID